jgi:sterol desaturase/sphingolipid hydroxylase (fatty acid hydroxylase superfamily)
MGFTMAGQTFRELYVLLYAMARLSMWLAIFAAIFVPIERIFALHSQKIFRKEIAVDLGYYFLNGLLPALVLGPPISFAVLAIHHFIPGGVLGAIAAWPIWLKAGATMMVGETAYYWAHRLSHQIPFLWRFHAVHHSAEQLDFLVNTRMHPVDLVWSRMIMLTPIFALGLANPVHFGDGLIATGVLLSGSMWGYFIHSNVRWRLGPFEWLLTTPAFHHWHHTNDGKRRDCNYASMFPWLDRVFGTHHLPEAWPERYGIDEPMPDSLAGQFIHPLAPSRPSLPARGSAAAE